MGFWGRWNLHAILSSSVFLDASSSLPPTFHLKSLLALPWSAILILLKKRGLYSVRELLSSLDVHFFHLNVFLMLLCGSWPGIEVKPGKKVSPFGAANTLGKLRITQVPYWFAHLLKFLILTFVFWYIFLCKITGTTIRTVEGSNITVYYSGAAQVWSSRIFLQTLVSFFGESCENVQVCFLKCLLSGENKCLQQYIFRSLMRKPGSFHFSYQTIFPEM